MKRPLAKLPPREIAAVCGATQCFCSHQTIRNLALSTSNVAALLKNRGVDAIFRGSTQFITARECKVWCCIENQAASWGFDGRSRGYLDYHGDCIAPAAGGWMPR